MRVSNGESILFQCMSDGNVDLIEGVYGDFMFSPSTMIVSIE